MDIERLRDIDRASSISFIVGLLAGDLTFRLSDPEFFRVALLISIPLAIAALMVRMFSDNFPMLVAMFPAGFAISAALKWLLLS